VIEEAALPFLGPIAADFGFFPAEVVKAHIMVEANHTHRYSYRQELVGQAQGKEG
jgi:hypothetical protein